MTRARQLKSTLLAIAVALTVAIPARAADPDAGRFKAEIQQFTDRIGATSDDAIKWIGADPYEIRREGDTLVAVITHARLGVDADHQTGRLTLDRIEIRRTPQQGGKVIDFAVTLPKEITFDGGAGTTAKISLTDGKADIVVDAQSELTQSTAIDFAAARFDEPKTGVWIRSGPMTMRSKVVAEPDGGWRGPADFELKRIEFFFPEGPAGGAIDRIAYHAKSAGPSFAALEKLRTTLSRLHNGESSARQARLAAALALLPSLPEALGSAGVEIKLEGLAVHGANGESLAGLKEAGIATKLTGLDGKAAALRVTLHQNGLALSPSLVDSARVPNRIVVDLGLENLATGALRDLLKTAVKIPGDGKADKQKKQQQLAQMLGAAAKLEPVFRVYDVAVDTKDVGLDLTGQASGSWLTKGYSAAGDLVVRGFDAIPALGPPPPVTQYLPLLAVLGIPEKAADGAPRLRFHLASGPQKWITINGNDVSAWFGARASQPGQPKLLRPAFPPMSGAEVKGVQHALAAAKIAVPQSGVYDGTTAAAVARFQKKEGLNISGVVDTATRAKLGIKPEPAGAAPKDAQK